MQQKPEITFNSGQIYIIIIDAHVSLACAMHSDSGVWLEVREREKIRRKRGRGREEGKSCQSSNGRQTLLLTELFRKKYVCVVVQFYPWFKFYFLLFQTHYHTLPYPKTKENKI